MTALRVSARWVLPLGAAPIPHGAVLVGADGRIAAVGRDAEVPSPPGAVQVALGEAALLPGLVNAHSHLELTALRGLVHDLPFFHWLRTVRAIKDGLDADAFRASARWGVLEAFAAGITALGDAGTTLQAAPALRDLGARGVAFHEVIGPDPARCGEAVEAAERALETLMPCGSERVAVGISPHAPYTVSDPLLRAVTALAAARGLRTAMHVAESREERAFVEDGVGPFAEQLRLRGIAVEARGRSTVEWLEDAGFLEGRPLLVHCVTARFDDFERARRHGATVAHCPWSNAVLGHGRADWAAMRRAGIVVGLGTDSVATGGRLDLFAEARLAVLALDGSLAPRALLRLVTADGAAALDLPGTGMLEPGGWGDLAAVDLSAPALADAPDPEMAVAWGATASDVVFTAVAGRVVFDHGHWPGVALEAERAACARAAARAAAVSRPAPAGDMFARPRR